MRTTWKSIFLGELSCILILLVVGGCANLATLQTARVEPAKKFKLTMSAGYADITSASFNGIGSPDFTAMLRFGLGKNLDIGIKDTLFGTLSIDTKYQFVDTNQFAMAIGLGFGIFSLSLGSIFEVSVPLYVSYDFTDAFSLYAAPRFTAGLSPVTYTINNSTINGNGPATYLGGSFGFKAGTKAGVLAEASYESSMNSSYPNLLEFDAAFFIGL